MPEGIIVKAYGGFFYVWENGQQRECVLRGRLRREKQPVLVGDRVSFTLRPENAGVIEQVLPRRTALVRPPVANVERAVITGAGRDPAPNPLLIDRFLIQAAAAGVLPLLCFNKMDLGPGEAAEQIAGYRLAGYTVLCTSAVTGDGIGELQAQLQTGISVLAGPSGVGKSSLLNALNPGWSLKTGAISRKLGRGKHTTRHVELLPLPGGGLVADTPGFSSLYLPELTREELAGFYPEIAWRQAACRFTGCLHVSEPGCAVKEAVAAGEIAPWRYENYQILLQEVLIQERRY
ncbi:ribosome small subunit-dependent GTPase A [Desulfotomaculum copahuensis]|uniref:Small ribosomal subunit biogenesis GTPase RsgA n=1 Tax=Desulfotomaculum copahuensis TaxID=1838280 RepID=A0A1B7LE99_9FIRM|nr:ribosome small subunit-dependent GTPase A [Desulfotomaculum copahuensis]OAT81410.1 ribosome small subunit-dependent GTPase A [Desulfotomaculum copahuensis]